MSGPDLCEHFNPIDDCADCYATGEREQRSREIEIERLTSGAFARGEKSGAAKERAAIVAWLRKQLAAIPDGDDRFHERESCRAWADVIEAEVHLPKGDTQ